jgi:PadR family transcriptional regulator PadR
MRLITRTEEFVLLAVWRLQKEAYSIPLRDELVALTANNWSLGAVYMPLERLVKKGMLTSSLSASTPERGGRQKRIYELTKLGKKALLHIREVEQRIWAGISSLAVD